MHCTSYVRETTYIDGSGWHKLPVKYYQYQYLAAEGTKNRH